MLFMSTECDSALAACKAIRKAEEDYGPALGGGTPIADILTPEVDALIDAALGKSSPSQGFSELDVLIDEAVDEVTAKVIKVGFTVGVACAIAACVLWFW